MDHRCRALGAPTELALVVSSQICIGCAEHQRDNDHVGDDAD
jgi:hypothetical protein